MGEGMVEGEGESVGDKERQRRGKREGEREGGDHFGPYPREKGRGRKGVARREEEARQNLTSS